jgi:hypothetical protein
LIGTRHGFKETAIVVQTNSTLISEAKKIMTITLVHHNWMLPVDWRITLGLRVKNLATHELDDAFSRALELLDKQSDEEVQLIIEFIAESIALQNGTAKFKAYAIAPDPRTFYEICSTAAPLPSKVSIMDGLAVGVLLALVFACRAMDRLKNTQQFDKRFTEAGAAIANARAFSEWLYIINLLKTKDGAIELIFGRKVRALTKKKITEKKSVAAKKGAASLYQLDRELIFSYYEENKLGAMSASQAASIIESAKLTNAAHSTIKTYIYEYRKKVKPQQSMEC